MGGFIFSTLKWVHNTTLVNNIVIVSDMFALIIALVRKFYCLLFGFFGFFYANNNCNNSSYK